MRGAAGQDLFWGIWSQVLLEHVHKAFLDAPVDKVGCMNPFRFG